MILMFKTSVGSDVIRMFEIYRDINQEKEDEEEEDEENPEDDPDLQNNRWF